MSQNEEPENEVGEAGGGSAGFRCDFCGEESPRVRRIALAPHYDRLLKPHRVKYACPACSEKKERELAAGR